MLLFAAFSVLNDLQSFVQISFLYGCSKPEWSKTLKSSPIMFVSVFAIVSHAAAYCHIYLHSIGGFKNILTENIGRSRMGMSGEIPPDSDNSE